VKSYRNQYYRRWKDDEASFDGILSNDIFEERWDRASDLPAMPVTVRLADGLACAYAGDMKRALCLFELTIRYADRREAEDRFHDTEVAEAGYPCNLAETLQARAYARWLLGEGLDRDQVRKAAEHFVEWCLTKPDDCRRFVSPVTMGFYLGGIRAAAVTGDIDYARQIAEAPHRFTDYHAEERNVWVRLLTEYPRVSADFRKEFECFFDRVRDPDFQVMVRGYPTFVRRDWLALDTGIIREMYLVNASPLDPVDPKAVIEAVAY